MERFINAERGHGDGGHFVCVVKKPRHQMPRARPQGPQSTKTRAQMPTARRAGNDVAVPELKSDATLLTGHEAVCLPCHV